MRSRVAVLGSLVAGCALLAGGADPGAVLDEKEMIPPQSFIPQSDELPEPVSGEQPMSGESGGFGEPDSGEGEAEGASDAAGVADAADAAEAADEAGDGAGAADVASEEAPVSASGAAADAVPADAAVAAAAGAATVPEDSPRDGGALGDVAAFGDGALGNGADLLSDEAKLDLDGAAGGEEAVISASAAGGDAGAAAAAAAPPPISEGDDGELASESGSEPGSAEPAAAPPAAAVAAAAAAPAAPISAPLSFAPAPPASAVPEPAVAPAPAAAALVPAVAALAPEIVSEWQQSNAEYNSLADAPAVSMSGRPTCAHVMTNDLYWFEVSTPVQMAFSLFTTLPASRAEVSHEKDARTDKIVQYALDEMLDWAQERISVIDLVKLLVCDADVAHGRPVGLKLVELGVPQALTHPFAKNFFLSREPLLLRDALGNNVFHMAALSGDVRTFAALTHHLLDGKRLSPKEIKELLNAPNAQGKKPLELAHDISLGLERKVKGFYMTLRKFENVSGRRFRSRRRPVA